MMRIKIVAIVIVAIVFCLTTLGACDSSSTQGFVAGTPGTIQMVDVSFDADEGTIVNILVARTLGSDGVVSVEYLTVDDTAVAGLDYTPASGTLTWANGVAGNQTISVLIADDIDVEPTELFRVDLTNFSMATPGLNVSATVNIIDND